MAVGTAHGVEDVVDVASRLFDGGGGVVDELVDAQPTQEHLVAPRGDANDTCTPGLGKLHVPEAPKGQAAQSEERDLGDRGEHWAAVVRGGGGEEGPEYGGDQRE